MTPLVLGARSNQIDRLLGKYALRKTDLRRQLLVEFVGARQALGQADLVERLSRRQKAIDRISVYRNLLQFKSVGLLHEVTANRYVLCAHECSKHAHILLSCDRCDRHFEITDHKRIDRVLGLLGPMRFFGDQHAVSMRGVCARCEARHS